MLFTTSKHDILNDMYFFTSDTLRIQKTPKIFLMMNKKLKDKLEYFIEKVNAESNERRK